MAENKENLIEKNKYLISEIERLLKETERVKLIESELRTHQIELELQNEELKQTQYELVVSRKKYRQLYEKAPVGYIMTNSNHRIMELNERAALLLKKSKNSALNKDLSVFVDKDSQNDFYFHFKQLHDIRQRVESEIMLRIDNEQTIVRFTSSLTSDDAKTAYINTTLEDITEKVKIEQQLESERLKYQELVENINDVIFQITPDGVFTYLSPVFNRTYNYNTKDIIGNHFLKFTHPDDALDIQGYFHRIMHQELDSFETRFIDKNGKSRYQRIRANVKYNDDEPIVITGVMTDITEKRIAEEQLKLSEALFKGAFDRTAIGMMLVSKEGKFLKVNKAFLDMMGYAREEILELSFVDITHPDDFGSSLQHIELIKKDQSFFVEKRYRRKDGKYIWCQLSTSIIPDSKGDVKFFISNVVDLSDRKESENKIQEYLSQLETSENQLKEMNRDKDSFFSIIATDLRNSLNDFMLLTEEFSIGIRNLTLMQMQEKSKEMYDSSQKLVKVLENLLDWSRAQTGSLKFEPREYDIYEFAVNNILILKDKAKEKNITIRNNIPMDTIAFIDYKMIDTIFRNLISNAIKYTQDGGLIQLLLKESDDSFFVSIQDNGIGISLDKQKKLFKIGERIINEVESSEPGTGLGLILCKEFISLHNGSISFDSEPGKGSTFSFSIPKH